MSPTKNEDNTKLDNPPLIAAASSCFPTRESMSLSTNNIAVYDARDITMGRANLRILPKRGSSIPSLNNSFLPYPATFEAGKQSLCWKRHLRNRPRGNAEQYYLIIISGYPVSSNKTTFCASMHNCPFVFCLRPDCDWCHAYLPKGVHDGSARDRVKRTMFSSG